MLQIHSCDSLISDLSNYFDIYFKLNARSLYRDIIMSDDERYFVKPEFLNLDSKIRRDHGKISYRRRVYVGKR